MKPTSAFIALSCLTANAYSANLVMPKELVEFAERNACTQLDDFYERPGPVAAPFVYAPSSTELSGSAFWCRKQDKASRTPYLLLLKDEPSFGKGCPNKVDWWNPPGGLAIRRVTVVLSNLRHVDDQQTRGPSTKATALAIVSSYDGVETTFICSEGRWLYGVRH